MTPTQPSIVVFYSQKEIFHHLLMGIALLLFALILPIFFVSMFYFEPIAALELDPILAEVFHMSFIVISSQLKCMCRHFPSIFRCLVCLFGQFV